MTLNEMIDLLNGDLSREYAHWHFYINASVCVQGLHRAEIGEFLLEQAQSEMKHIEQFARMIIGLGGTPTTNAAAFVKDYCHPLDILREALKMEKEVIDNYVIRMDQCDVLEQNGFLDRVEGRYIHLFLEDQLLDSRADANNIREMIRLNPNSYL